MDAHEHESDLVLALARGDDDAFGALYDQFARPLYALGLRWLQDVDDAEEFVSDTLVEAWRHAGRFDPGKGRAGSWLFGIARHVATDRLRRRGRRPVTDQGTEADLVAHLDVERMAAAWDIAAALEELPPNQREVLLLAYRDDLSQARIAQVLGIPLGTVKSRTYHALRAMAGLIEPVRPTAEAEARPARAGLPTAGHAGLPPR